MTEFKGDREPRLLTGLYVIADELEGIDSAEGKKPVYGKSKTGERIFSVSSVDDGLIIRANQKTHHEIEEMIALLRKHQQVKKLAESKVQQAASEVNLNANHTSYLDEPSAFDEVMWDLPLLNEKLPPMSGTLRPSIIMPLENKKFDFPDTHKSKYGDFVGYGAGTMILPETKKPTSR